MRLSATFATTQKDEDLIEAERKRLAAVNPGTKVSKSDAIRSLIHRGSTTTDEANVSSKSISSDVFKEKGSPK